MRTSKNKIFLIICMAILMGVLIYYAFYKEAKYKDEDLRQQAGLCYPEEELWAEQQFQDSLARVKSDSIHKADSLEKLKNKDNPLRTRDISYSDYDDEEEYNSSAKRRHGTTPDDGMFGFDYYDDPDDNYHMERNQTDPYPDEKDW